MLLRLAYLAVTHDLAAVRLLPMSDREKDAENLVLRHQIAVLERQLCWCCCLGSPCADRELGHPGCPEPRRRSRRQIPDPGDRDGKFPPLFDQILAEAGIQVVLIGVRMPRMNSIMECWVQSCRHVLDRTLIWNESHL